MAAMPAAGGSSASLDAAGSPKKPQRESAARESNWLVEARRRARDRLDRIGLPQRRDEYWKYTNPGTLANGASASAPGMGEFGFDKLHMESDPNGALAVFEPNGPGRIESTGSGAPEAATLSTVASKPRHWSSEIFGRLEASAQNPVARGLAALNSVEAMDGLVVRCIGSERRSLTIQYRHTGVGERQPEPLHHVIKVEPGSDLRVLEVGSSRSFKNIVFEVDVGDGATYSHIRIQDQQSQPRSVNHVFARVGQQGRLNLFSLSANHELIRNECVVQLSGEGGAAHVAGATIGGSGSHHDDTVLVKHEAPRCQSRQVFKKVLLDDSVGVFQGKILVRDGAQKTDGYQISKGLLVGENSQFLAKPELEIYADDVICSHGSTSGSADADALFYLRARGIPYRDAISLLALAFLAETLEEIDDQDSVEMLRSLMVQHLAAQSDGSSV